LILQRRGRGKEGEKCERFVIILLGKEGCGEYKVAEPAELYNFLSRVGPIID
jgi:hypothetical protein